MASAIGIMTGTYRRQVPQDHVSLVDDLKPSSYMDVTEGSSITTPLESPTTIANQQSSELSVLTSSVPLQSASLDSDRHKIKSCGSGQSTVMPDATPVIELDCNISLSRKNNKRRLATSTQVETTKKYSETSGVIHDLTVMEPEVHNIQESIGLNSTANSKMKRSETRSESKPRKKPKTSRRLQNSTKNNLTAVAGPFPIQSAEPSATKILPHSNQEPVLRMANNIPQSAAPSLVVSSNETMAVPTRERGSSDSHEPIPIDKDPHANSLIASPSKSNSVLYGGSFCDISKSDPLLGFSSSSVSNSHLPVTPIFPIRSDAVAVNHPRTSTHVAAVLAEQISNTKPDLLPDRHDKPLPSPIEFSPLSFTESTTAYDLNTFLTQSSTPPLDTNSCGKSPYRVSHEMAPPLIVSSHKTVQVANTGIPLQCSSIPASLNLQMNASCESTFNGVSVNAERTPVNAITALNNTTATLTAQQELIRHVQVIHGQPAYDSRNCNNTLADKSTTARNLARYNICPRSANYVPSSVFDTLYVQHGHETLPCAAADPPFTSSSIYSAENESTDVTCMENTSNLDCNLKKLKKMSRDKARSSASFLSKFTNANFKEVDVPSSSQPFTSLIHSQTIAEKSKMSEDRKCGSGSKKKSQRKRDIASSLPKVTVPTDNSAAYGPLHDSSLINSSGENGSTVAQPATSPIAALLLQSTFQNVLTQDAIGVSGSDHVDSPSSNKCEETNTSHLGIVRSSPGPGLLDMHRTSPHVNHCYNSSTRTVVSPAGFHPALSPTQSFTFPISACGGSRNSGSPDANNVSDASFNPNSNSSTFVAPPSPQMLSSNSIYGNTQYSSLPLSTLITSQSSQLLNHSNQAYNSTPKSSCCVSAAVTSYFASNTMPSPTHSYGAGSKILHRNGSPGLPGAMTPPLPFMPHSSPTSPFLNTSISSLPRITSPVINHDNSMLYTSSRIAAGSSMSPPLSSLIPGSPTDSSLHNSSRGSNVTVRGSSRPLLSPTTLLGLPFSSMSPDIANLEPPLPCTSGNIPVLSELELTSDDLPRLLSAGDNSSQSCGASKLLDTNTADLTEIIQKLQQETAGAESVENCENAVPTSVNNFFRSPAPSFKGVLQNKHEGDVPCNGTHQDIPETAGAFAVPYAEKSDVPRPMIQSQSSEIHSGITSSNNLENNLQNSNPNISSNESLITSFTDVLSSSRPYPSNSITSTHQIASSNMTTNGNICEIMRASTLSEISSMPGSLDGIESHSLPLTSIRSTSVEIIPSHGGEMNHRPLASSSSNMSLGSTKNPIQCSLNGNGVRVHSEHRAISSSLQSNSKILANSCDENFLSNIRSVPISDNQIRQNTMTPSCNGLHANDSNVLAFTGHDLKTSKLTHSYSVGTSHPLQANYSKSSSENNLVEYPPNSNNLQNQFSSDIPSEAVGTSNGTITNNNLVFTSYN